MATATFPEVRSRFFSRQEIAAVRRPLNLASFLPPRIYSDDAIFDFEKAAMFRRSWLPFCHVSQLPQAGSYVARQLFDESLIALRGGDGALNVFSNVCRHRNAALTLPGIGRCKGKRISCPYHGWTYVFGPVL